MNKALVSVIVGMGLWAAPADAQTSQRADANAVWTKACSVALGERVHKEHPGATKVETIAKTLEQWAESNTETGVRGDGQFLKGSDWTRFQFRCVYNTSSNRIAHLSHSVKAAAGAAGPVRSRASADAYTSKACSAEIEKRIAQARPRARVEIVADGFEEWQVSDTETGVYGRGQSLAPDGDRQQFTFECRCNTRAKTVSRADIKWVR
jgi:hypothetical protein